MQTIGTALTSKRWWAFTGVAMAAGVGAAFGLGAAPLVAVLVGAGAAFVGAFAQVLNAAANAE